MATSCTNRQTFQRTFLQWNASPWNHAPAGPLLNRIRYSRSTGGTRLLLVSCPSSSHRCKLCYHLDQESLRGTAEFLIFLADLFVITSGPGSEMRAMSTCTPPRKPRKTWPVTGTIHEKNQHMLLRNSQSNSKLVGLSSNIKGKGLCRIFLTHLAVFMLGCFARSRVDILFLLNPSTAVNGDLFKHSWHPKQDDRDLSLGLQPWKRGR